MGGSKIPNMRLDPLTMTHSRGNLFHYFDKKNPNTYDKNQKLQTQIYRSWYTLYISKLDAKQFFDVVWSGLKTNSIRDSNQKSI